MRFFGVIGTLIVGFLVTAALWWNRDHSLWQSPAPIRPDIPSPKAIGLRSVDSEHASLVRPFLWVSRRPPLPPRAVTAEDAMMDDVGKAQLLAVLGSGEEQIALLRLPDSRIVKFSRQSQPLRLSSFDGREAVFVTAEGKQVARLLGRAQSR